ncbi:MAG: RICIN domain-containing protein [Micrococcales bacterium]|nr:RICIN domain-containing protein [Micrococcales bacterium]
MTRVSAKPRVLIRRVTAVAAAAVLAVTATGLVEAPAPAAAASPTQVSLSPNPWYANPDFEGWGTSLVWFANATGGYPDALKEQLYQAVFGEDGLNLNIARYNIGGGNASGVWDYLRPGGAVQGWWKADPNGDDGVYGGVGTNWWSRNDLLAAWNSSDDSMYNFDADATQRWWVQRLAEDPRQPITHWEAFANSAPYFMTESGYVSGGTNATAEQLKPAAIDKFAQYLVRVAEYLEATYGISFSTIDPLNEPNTNYWSTSGPNVANGQPSGGRQEGMHVGPARQAALVQALAAALAGADTDAVVSAMDETNPDIFKTNWTNAAYTQAVRDAISQLNVHTYGTSGRLQVGDFARAADKPLWMSEIEGSWVNGWNPTSIENGIGIAGRINDDLRELQPKAWVLWQPVEDLYNMQPSGENLNWGSVFIDLDCKPYDEGGVEVWKSKRRVDAAGGVSTGAPACGVEVNSKYNTIRNYTHFIRPGDSLIAVDNTSTTAAVSADGRTTTLVYTNSGTTAADVTLDLSKFGAIAPGASVTPYVTTQASSAANPTGNALVQGAAVPVNATTASAKLTVPAKSVTTFVVSGVSGVSDAAMKIVDGGTYQLVGVQSGKALTATAMTNPPTRITTLNSSSAGQAWTFHQVGDASDRRFVVVAGDGRVLGATSSNTDLRTGVSLADAAANPQTQWIVTSTNGTDIALLNVAMESVLDVGSSSTAENASVGWWGNSGGGNQRWKVRDLAPKQVTVTAHTSVGVPVTPPATVAATYLWGTGAAVPVTWDAIPASAWDAPGRVEVAGTATDPLGRAFATTLLVDVGTLGSVDPASATVVKGLSLAAVQASAPTTVRARQGASELSFAAPVTWNWSGLSDASFASVGIVTVPGTASLDGVPTPATLSVIVADSTGRNIAPDSTTVASATYTESASYGVDRTRNNNLTDKGWSNWRSGTQNASDTLTYTFPAQLVQGSTVYLYADGTNSWPSAIQFQYRVPGGAWTTVTGTVTANPALSTPYSSGMGTVGPIVALTFPPVTADGFRVVLTRQTSNTHMIVSEVQIFTPVAATSSLTRLAELRVDGVDAGCNLALSACTFDAIGAHLPVVQAFPLDTKARVSVVQPSEGNGGVATITTVAEDGTTASYILTIARTVAAAASISGTVEVGSTVSAVAELDPSDATVGYQWTLDGVDIPGATSVSYVPTPAQAGGVLRVVVTASKTGFTGTTATSTPATIAAPTGFHDASLASLTVGGQPVDGFSPSVTSYTVPVTGSAFPVVGATAAGAHATVQLTQASGGTPVATVVVTAWDGVTTTTYQLSFDRKIALSAALSAAPVVGVPLTASVVADPAGAVLGYQWTLDGVDVPDADGASYTPVASDAGKRLAVVVTASATGFTGTTASSAGEFVTSTPVGTLDLELSATTVTRGDTLVVEVSGLTPNGAVALELHSIPVALGTFTATSSGTLSATARIPSGTAPGAHHIVVRDLTTSATAEAPITVLAAAGDLAGTGVPDTVRDTALLATLLLAAGALLAIRRRRGPASR